MNHLVPCPECNRHVRTTEAECPFCAQPLDLAGTPEPLLPRVRLGRAATFAFGATLASATALAACSSDGQTVAPAYGVPPDSGGATSTAGTAGASAGAAGSVAGATNAGGTGSAMPVYGAPAAGGFGTGTAGTGAGGGGQFPVYGGAP